MGREARLLAVSWMLILLTAAAGAPTAGASRAVAPPPGRTLLAVYSWDIATFEATAGRRHAIRSRFVDWDPRLTPGETWADTIASAEGRGQSLEVHWAPARWNGGARTEALSPGQIARGAGDDVILHAALELSRAQRPVLLRFAAEMNGWWQPYSAYNRDGTARDPDHAASDYVAAWRRVRTIFAGGSVEYVNSKLAELDQPPLISEWDGIVGAPDTTFVWSPNLASQPRMEEQGPDAYYPGDEFVDWVGVDVYDDDPWGVVRPLLEKHYGAHPAKPFALSEWGVVSGEDNAQFAESIFDWVESHPRVASMHWFDSRPSRLRASPAAAEVYRRRTRSAAEYLSGWIWDADPPETRIESGPGTTTDRTPSFRFSADELGARFECRIDRRTWRRCTSGRAMGPLPLGRHRFTVRATDAEGNVDPSPASRIFTVVRPSSRAQRAFCGQQQRRYAGLGRGGWADATRRFRLPIISWGRLERRRCGLHWR